ncbi:Protein tipD [Tetrabaena socialis]|uniref:Protein tipD n=1 Tax=Tetrabaena socialis TaxID=47790 RepID=A0A2J7ZZ42_9CHLO|nr:Protein tipD [Tetrabaena socialis]|eukprot:PNH05539.1 Protein tipD [Tetrabaena socialis]
MAGAGGSAVPAISLQGMTSAVNDCAFTCDAAQVVAAGADKSLHVWDATTAGRARHTLTGHTGPVTAVAVSPLDCRLAVSISEDRSFKLWDLGRGFAVRSVPCAKMPLSLVLSADSNTVVTGHLDGSVLLWDVRQCRAGAAAPLLELSKQRTRIRTPAMPELQERAWPQSDYYTKDLSTDCARRRMDDTAPE